jgi:gas vesicle protein
MNKITGALLAFLAGTAVGTSLGILYAPDKGTNTRDKLNYQLDKYRVQLTELVEELVNNRSGYDNVAKSEGQRVIDDAREKAERLLGDVEQLMGQIRNRR